jgi:hypothetical protein
MSKIISSKLKNCGFIAQKANFSTPSSATAKFIDLESRKSAHNYHPIPKVLCRGKGVFLWDVDGKVRKI